MSLSSAPALFTAHFSSCCSVQRDGRMRTCSGKDSICFPFSSLFGTSTISTPLIMTLVALHFEHLAQGTFVTAPAIDVVDFVFGLSSKSGSAASTFSSWLRPRDGWRAPTQGHFSLWDLAPLRKFSSKLMIVPCGFC